MTNVTTKFKERGPKETIALIRAFFAERGFQTECFAEHSDVGTHYCKVNLYYKGVSVLDTNGKGMTEDYSMASGYAELYERFCNQINYLHNPFWCEAVMEKNRVKFGYAFDAEERVISDEEAIRSPVYAALFQSMFRTGAQRVRGLRVMLGSSPVTEVPYTDFVTGEKVYMDPRLLLRMDRSKGCAAGNTATEAFNQSLSELLEGEVETSVMLGEMKTFTRISNEYLKNFPELYEVIKNIRSQGNELYILDFGYATGFPVLASVLVHKDSAGVMVNFGAFPVFEIALERVLTELYQGRRSCRERLKAMRPWRESEKYRIACEGANNITEALAYPSGMFLDPEVADAPSKCFLTSRVEGNEAIFEYFQALCLEKGLTVCWRDTSMMEEVAAVRVFILGCSTFRAKGGAYERSGAAFVDRELSKMERYIEQCYSVLSGSADLGRFSEMLQRFGSINGNYVGSLLNGEYLDLKFTKVPILTFAYQAILNGFDTDLETERTIGKQAAMLRVFHTFDRETCKKLFALCGLCSKNLDIGRLRDRDYLFEKVIREPLLDSLAFMREMVDAYPCGGI